MIGPTVGMVTVIGSLKKVCEEQGHLSVIAMAGCEYEQRMPALLQSGCPDWDVVPSTTRLPEDWPTDGLWASAVRCIRTVSRGSHVVCQ
jgi:hypothetical protein